jgi:aryl-alcohol dehydrogenase-like predicted oxidoreductase
MDPTRDWLSPKVPGARAAAVLGTMNFGKRTPEPEAFRIMERALERGVSWFDTANAYGDSELILGRFLRGRPDVKVATKCGIGNMSGPSEGLSAKVVRAAVDASLKRLQREHLDLYYLHMPDRGTPIEETLGALAEAHRAGKIGAWGVSNFASWRVAELNHACGAIGLAKPRVSQVLYNLLVRQLEIEYFDFARHTGLHTTIYNPLAGGLLAGKTLANLEPGGRFDKNTRYQKRYLTPRLEELASSFAQLAADAGIDRVALAYGFAAQHPGVDTVLLGPATVAQLDAGLDGCAQELGKDMARKIDELHRAYAGTDASYAR